MLESKSDRLQLRQLTIDRQVSQKNATVQQYKDLTMVMWGEDARNTAHLIYWIGTAGHPTENLYFTGETCDAKLFAYVQRIQKSADAREASKQAKKNTVAPERKDEQGFVLADIRKTSALLKKYLREKFGVDFKISSKTYTGGCSLDISYTNGPDKEEVEKIANRLERGNFNGMEDIYENKNEAEYGLIIDGFKLHCFKYVFVNRSISEEVMLQMAQSIEAVCKTDFPSPQKPADIYEFFGRHINDFSRWSEYLHRFATNNIHFVTDSQSIKINRAYHPANGAYCWHFEYTFNGKEYTTENLTTYEPTVKAAKHIEKNGVKMVDYSERAVAVIGNTYEIREQLKAIGGTFNKFLKVGGEQVAGWIFSKSRESELSDLLINYAAA